MTLLCHTSGWAAVLFCVLLAAPPALAWGQGAHRLITNKAIDSLPPELEGFFAANRQQIVQQSLEPLELAARNPAERKNRYLYLDRYGRFPFDALPRDYNVAVKQYGKPKLEQNGVLPWQIGLYSLRLTNAFRSGNWEEARKAAALLAHYVAQSHDPFATTENFDGKITAQSGVDVRFNTNLVDRFSLFFFIRPNDAALIEDPTDHAFESCLTAHSWLQQVLLSDRRARQGLTDYTDEYFARLYNQAGAILIRQLSEASTDVGSYWYTAWVNAGRPRLPQR